MVTNIDQSEVMARAKTRTIYLETTEVPAERTAGEISSLLAQNGATKILSEYGPDGKAIGLTFGICVKGRDIAYRLPIRTKPIFDLLQSSRKHSRWKYTESDKAQAVRIAWRQTFRWIQAQMAMIQTGMVDVQEAFAAYTLCAGGQTLYERLTEGQYKLLEMDASK